MIVAERKPLAEIVANVKGVPRLLVVGCNTCVAVCLAGGTKEVAMLGSMLRLALRESSPPIQITENCVERQCEEEFNQPLAEQIAISRRGPLHGLRRGRADPGRAVPRSCYLSRA